MATHREFLLLFFFLFFLLHFTVLWHNTEHRACYYYCTPIATVHAIANVYAIAGVYCGNVFLWDHMKSMINCLTFKLHRITLLECCVYCLWLIVAPTIWLQHTVICAIQFFKHSSVYMLSYVVFVIYLFIYLLFIYLLFIYLLFIIYLPIYLLFILKDI